MNCPRCGKKDINKVNLANEMLLALLVDAGCRTNHKFEYCDCKPGLAKPRFWKANNITRKRAAEKGEFALKVWDMHHEPNRRDCVDLNYGYHITPNQRVICNAGNDYFDITEEVLGEQ